MKPKLAIIPLHEAAGSSMAVGVHHNTDRHQEVVPGRSLHGGLVGLQVLTHPNIYQLRLKNPIYSAYRLSYS